MIGDEARGTGSVDFSLCAGIVAYWLLYVGYLFIRPEGEIAHWVSLVAIPCIALAFALGRSTHTMAWASVWRIVGIRRAGSLRALMCAVLAGGAMTVLQLFGRQGNSARVLFGSMAGWGWLAAGFVLMCATAAATEEFFFRGVVQGSLSRWRIPSWAAGAVATLMFVAYHVPYAYMSPQWASHGNIPAAIGAAAGNALFVGALLSVVYVVSGRHLLGPWMAHALTNMVPGALYLQRHFGAGG